MKTRNNSIFSVAVALGLFLVACGEEVSEPLPPADPGIAPAEAYPDVEAGETSLRRLTQEQFKNSIADIFGTDIVIPEVAEPDIEIGGLLAVGSSGATFSARGVESLETASFAVAEQAMASDESRARLIPCTPAATVDADCAKQTVESLGRLAWRRSLTTEESDRLVAIANDAAEKLESFNSGIEAIIAALIQSPKFMFRVELGEGQGQERQFTGVELAS